MKNKNCWTHAKLGGSGVRQLSWEEHCVELDDVLTKELQYNRALRPWSERVSAVRCWSINVRRRLQNGPTCGLEAARSAVEWLIGGDGPQHDEVLAAAVDRGLTKQGEFFYAADLVSLCNDVLLGRQQQNQLQLRAKLVELDGEPTSARRRSSFLAAATPDESAAPQLRPLRPVLVPYDADPSGRPALRGGAKAHWCLVIGLVHFERGERRDEHDLPPISHSRDRCPGFDDNIEDDGGTAVVGVLYVQTKSRRPVFALLDDLLASCGNLRQVPVSDRVNPDHFKIPNDLQLITSLSNKLIMFT